MLVKWLSKIKKLLIKKIKLLLPNKVNVSKVIK